MTRIRTIRAFLVSFVAHFRCVMLWASVMIASAAVMAMSVSMMAWFDPIELMRMIPRITATTSRACFA